MVNHNRDDKLDYCEADNVSISMDITIDLDLVGVILSANSAITKMMMTTITMMTALIEMALLMKMMMQLIKKSLKRCFSKIWRFLYYDFEEEHPVKREDGFAFNILLGSPSHQISQPITLLYHHFSSILVTCKFFFLISNTDDEVFIIDEVFKYILPYNLFFAMFSSYTNHAPPPDCNRQIICCFLCQMHHHVGLLHPPMAQQPRYARIYILDIAEATQRRCRNDDV